MKSPVLNWIAWSKKLGRSIVLSTYGRRQFWCLHRFIDKNEASDTFIKKVGATYVTKIYIRPEFYIISIGYGA